MNRRELPRILAALIGIALVVIGLAALLSPQFAARQYGVAATSESVTAYVRAAGVRDAVIGGLLLLLLYYRVRGRLLGAALFIAALIPAGDFLIVLLSASNSRMALMVHGASVPVMIALGAWLWRES